MSLIDLFRRRKKPKSRGPSALPRAASPRRNDGSKWPGGLSGGSSLLIDHAAYRRQGRRAYHESIQARALVGRFADTIVGRGLHVEPTIDANQLGLSEEQAEAWREETERDYDAWCRSRDHHRRGLMTFYEAQRLYSVADLRDGENFVRLYYSRRHDAPHPLQFGFVDPTRICGDVTTSPTYPYLQRTSGIITDDAGRETAYLLADTDPQGRPRTVRIPRVGPRSGRLYMIHSFTPVYQGQQRGYSRLGHALQELESVTDYSLSTIKKAINQSSFFMAVENTQQAPIDPFELSSRAGSGPRSAPSDSGEEESPEPPPPDPYSYSPLPEASISQPGSVGLFNLRQGDSVKMLDHGSGAESFGTFVDSFTAYLAASMGMPIEVLLMRFSSNYSASRASLILFWRVANMYREQIDASLISPIYEQWLSEEISSGRRQCPGWSDPEVRSAWLSHRLVGDPAPTIDPVRSAQASLIDIQLGATTLDRVARDSNGSNGRANRRRLKRELAELVLPPWLGGEKKEERA